VNKRKQVNFRLFSLFFPTKHTIGLYYLLFSVVGIQTSSRRNNHGDDEGSGQRKDKDANGTSDACGDAAIATRLIVVFIVIGFVACAQFNALVILIRLDDHVDCTGIIDGFFR
jgi:hypothetical protein